MHFKLKFHPQVTSPGGVYPSPSAGHYWHLHRAIGSRCLASTSTSSTSPFPFPTHRNPTPHQIFHLPPGASQSEIKARCTPHFPSSSPKDPHAPGADYELARTFHPDSTAAQAFPASERQAHFHAVSRAYDVLRGKPHPDLYHDGSADDLYAAELARRRRQHARRQAYRHRGAAEFADTENMDGADEAWKDQVIIFVGLAVRTTSLIPSPAVLLSVFLF
jgi:hypothetical protein